MIRGVYSPIGGVSVSVQVDRSQCLVCGKVRERESQGCEHIRLHKGSGRNVEVNRGLRFTSLSIVGDGAFYYIDQR